MRRHWRPAATYGLAWLLLSTLAGLWLFVESERTVDFASHEAVVSPDLSGMVVIRTGPVLPSLRLDSGTWVGVEIELGKTDAPSVEALAERYAAIASQPDAQVDKLQSTVVGLAVDAAARGAALGALPPLVWLAIGRSRRREIVAGVPTRAGLVGLLAAALVVVGLTVPWRGLGGPQPFAADEAGWVRLSAFLGPEVPLPDELDRVEVLADATTGQTRRLIESAVSTYRQSRAFYATAAEAAAELGLREPREGETAVLMVSDRHDNIGMDQVARAVADRAGASYVFDAGDDTSTGQDWEAFSLDSLADTFDDFEGRWAVAGNHDHGTFVRSYLEDHGWTYFDGEVVDGPGDTRMLGVDDPRSSGLGNWRDESGLTFDDVEERLAEAACAAHDDGDRVSTILVHDANLASTALERGCADLVLGGHTHVTDGPTRVLGANGEVGYSFTLGTTGGAAYAIAIGSKIRRSAALAILTYADGRPTGIQAVTLETTGRFEVGPYAELRY